MNFLNVAIAAFVFLVVAWFAYKLGKFILRVLAGLLFLVILGYGAWYFIFR
jgi:hypothetical protein